LPPARAAFFFFRACILKMPERIRIDLPAEIQHLKIRHNPKRGGKTSLFLGLKITARAFLRLPARVAFFISR
jgi:hypothetical protein